MEESVYIKIILFLLDALEEEHMGLRDEYWNYIKQLFGVDIYEQLKKYNK